MQGSGKYNDSGEGKYLSAQSSWEVVRLDEGLEKFYISSFIPKPGASETLSMPFMMG